MSAPELVRSTCAAVADQAQHVSISEDSLRTIARSVTPETLEQIRKKTFDTGELPSPVQAHYPEQARRMFP